MVCFVFALRVGQMALSGNQSASLKLANCCWTNLLPDLDRRKYREAVARMMRGDVTILMRMRLACSLWSGSGKKILRDGRGMGTVAEGEPAGPVGWRRVVRC